MLHDAGDEDVFRIAERVDVDFDGVFEEVVDEDGALLRVLDGLAHVARDGFGVVGNDHGAAAEDVAGTDEDGIADALGDGQRLLDAGGGAAGRLRNLQIFKQFAEVLAVFGEVDGFGRGADDGHAGGEEALGEVERRLAAELDDHADLRAGLRFVVVDGENVFKHERLKVEAVAGVVVGGDGLRVAVDHDGLVAVVLERESGVAAAVVELDALADAVGAGAENDDLGRCGRRRLVLFVVGGVEVGRHGFEFGGAGVDELEDGANSLPFAQFPHLLDAVVAFELPLGGDALVAEAEALEPAACAPR